MTTFADNPDLPSSTGAMIPTMMAPTPSSSSLQPAQGTSGSEPSQPYYYEKTDTLRIVLDCVFAIAAMVILAGFVFWRYIALRRARRPMRDFFRPATDEEYRVPYQPEYSTVILPMPANLTIPPQSHPYERRVERAYREAEWLPAYDDKDMPPKYIEATSTVDYLPNRPNVYPPPPGSPPPPAPSPGEHS